MAVSLKSILDYFCRIYAVKGKEISIFLQIWTRKYVYLWNLTCTWSDTIRPCQNIHRNAPGGQILNFQNMFNIVLYDIGHLTIQRTYFFTETMKSMSLRFLVLLFSISKVVVLFFFSFRPLTSGRKYLDCLNFLQYLMVPHNQENVLLYHRSVLVMTGFEFHWCI